MESAVFPGAHLCDQIGTDELFGNQELVYVSFEQFTENIFGKKWSRDLLNDSNLSNDALAKQLLIN